MLNFNDLSNKRYLFYFTTSRVESHLTLHFPLRLNKYSFRDKNIVSKKAYEG